MIRWSAIAASLLAASTLFVGCTSSSAPTASGAAPAGGAAPAAGQKVRIGVSIPSATHGWTAGVNWWAEQTKALYPDAEITIVTSDSPSKQVSDIEAMLAKGVDGMVILATESAAITPVAKTAKERGVYVVSVDRGFTEPVADIFLEGDNIGFGRVAAEFMSKKLNGNGKVIALQGLPSTVNTDRLNGFKEAIKSTPGIQIVAEPEGGWNRDQAYKAVQTLLPKHADLAAVWAADDDMALGVEQALKEANRTNVWIVGGGGMKDVVKKVMDKDAMFPATVTYSPNMIASGIHMAVSALRDGNIDKKRGYLPRHMRISVDLVTPENAQQFYFADSIY